MKVRSGERERNTKAYDKVQAYWFSYQHIRVESSSTRLQKCSYHLKQQWKQQEGYRWVSQNFSVTEKYRQWCWLGAKTFFLYFLYPVLQAMSKQENYFRKMKEMKKEFLGTNCCLYRNWNKKQERGETGKYIKMLLSAMLLGNRGFIKYWQTWNDCNQSLSEGNRCPPLFYKWSN